MIWTTLAASPAPNAKIRQNVIILEKSNSDLWQTKKVFTKTVISLEPLDRRRFNTPQIEALCLGNLKNTSGGLWDALGTQESQRRSKTGLKNDFFGFFSPYNGPKLQFHNFRQSPRPRPSICRLPQVSSSLASKKLGLSPAKIALSIPAKIPYNAMSSKCDLKIKVWCKRKGRHQRPPILSFFQVIWTTLAAPPPAPKC